MNIEKDWGKKMKKIRKWKKVQTLICVMLGIFGVLILDGCGSFDKENGHTESVANEETEDSIQIGLSVDSFIIERWIRDRDVFVTTAKELGAEVNVQDAGGDVEEQISQIEYFIKKKMDVIMVIACDCDALSEVMKKAKEAGIKTVSYDRMVHNAKSDLYISFDSKMVGRLMAEALIEAIPEGGKILMIQGAEEDDNVALKYEGFMEAAADSKLEVVYEVNCAGWRAELAAEYMEIALDKFHDVKGIMCGNDDIASQVVKVLSERQMAGDIVVVAQDGDLAACQRIVEGTQYMTAFKDIDDLAREAAGYAVKLAEGKSLGEGLTTENDGTYDVPAVILAPVAVKKENMDEVIVKGGFHTQEDVYLNVGFVS